MVVTMNERVDVTRKSENEPLGKPLFTLWSEDGFYWVNKEDGLRYPISVDGVVLKQQDGSFVKHWEFDLEEIVWLMNNSDLKFDFEIQTYDKDKDICACEVTSINDLGKKYYYYKREFLEGLSRSTQYELGRGRCWKFIVKGLQIYTSKSHNASSLNALKTEYINNSGDNAKTIIYRNNTSVDVKFENGYIGNFTKASLEAGEFSNIKLLRAEHNDFSDNLTSRYYRISIMSNKTGHSTDHLRETSNEWKASYNVFKKWISMDVVAQSCFDKGEQFDIDTDALSQGTKCYGEDTAICLPRAINSTMQPRTHFKYPRRVHLNGKGYVGALFHPYYSIRGKIAYNRLKNESKDYYISLGKLYYNKYPNSDVSPKDYGLIAYLWEQAKLVYDERVKKLCQDYVNRGLLTQERAELVIAYHESRTILD